MDVGSKVRGVPFLEKKSWKPFPYPGTVSFVVMNLMKWAFNTFTPRRAKFYGYFRSEPRFGPPLKGSGALPIEIGGKPTYAPRPLVSVVLSAFVT